jgi:uncharacterized iron-regulated membrane protein
VEAARRVLSTFWRRPQEVVLRKALFQLHMWTGIGVGLYVFVVGLTGALLVFRNEIQQAAFPAFFRVPDATRPYADIDTVLEEFKRAYPDQPISGIDTPTPTRGTYLTYVLEEGRYVAAFAHPTTGKVLGELPPRSFVSRLQDLHFELLAGPTGRVLNGIGAICLTILALTGLVIWWPGVASWKRALRVDFSRGWRRVNFELHSTIGIWMSVLVLAWGLSGAYFIFSSEFRAIVHVIAPLTSPPAFASNPSLEGTAPSRPVAFYIHQAQQQQPSGELIRVLLPTSDGASLVVTLTHSGLSRAEDDQGISFHFDQNSGALLGTWDGAPRTAGDRVIAVLAPLHIGMFGGVVVKLLWVLLGLAPSVLFVTGSIMWWNRVVRDRWSRIRSRPVALAPLFVLATLAPAAGQGFDAAQVSHSGKGAYEVSLTHAGDGLAVSWYDTRDGRTDIYFARIDAEGRAMGPDQRLTSGDAQAFEPDIVSTASDLVVAWYEKAANGALTAKLGAWTFDGRPRWTRALSTMGRNGRNPVVRVSGRRIFAAWLEYAGDDTPVVFAQWFDAEGRPAAAPTRLADAGPTTWNLNAAVDDSGKGWVVFDGKAGTRSDELFLARLDDSTAVVTRLSADDGIDSKYPDIEFHDGHAALTWFDKRYGKEEIYLFVGSVEEVQRDVESRARRITENEGESIGAYLAWNGPSVGLAWCDDSEGQQEIYFQRFDERGVPSAEPQRVTRNETSSLIPAIVSWRGGFALAWNEFAPGRLGPHDPDGRSQVMFTTIGAAPSR